ncbi:ABC transporter permease [Yinghuangia sp. ASG 101]|uniref:ABC transporter permease n=1 Tax=Yinghuangia sp. ASG 101 TaxID=2896848 RepID=UPI001E5280C8|nr:ABC transporter permease [Yinghuangia sp. ASG 101]UGQ09040.1 ABC transporter permease [Yinghuangia sp. ASG 101]
MVTLAPDRPPPPSSTSPGSRTAGASDTAVSAPRRRSKARRVPLGLWFSGSVAAVLLFLAAFGPLIVGDTETSHLDQRLYGFGEHGHLLGTDGQGRDVLARMIAGARPSLIAGLVPVLIAAVVGSALGITAGLAGRVVHTAVMRTLDVLYAFPAVLLAVAIGASLGSGVSNAVISLSVVLVPPVARVAETETARLRGMDFMDSARASGATRTTIAVRQVLPNLLPTIVVYCTALAGLSIVFAAGLSFLGLGTAPPHAEWGLMVNDLRPYIFTDPALSLVPAAAILVASVACNTLGDGLRDLLDVRREVTA